MKNNTDHKILKESVNQQNKTGECSICGTVKVIVGSRYKSTTYWRCPNYTPSKSTGAKVGRPNRTKHTISNLDKDICMCDCDLCGPGVPAVKKTSSGKYEYWFCRQYYNDYNEKYLARACKGRAMHTLTLRTDTDCTRIADCKICGEVYVIKQGAILAGWMCNGTTSDPQNKPATKPLPKSHRLSGINTELKTATCARCGPNTTVLYSEQNGQGSWKCPTSAKFSRILTKYGLSEDDYWEIFDHQGGLCAICNELMDVVSVDHLHVDGDRWTSCGKENVRGLLCTGCNTGIGKLKDSIERLKSAIAYLQDPPAQKVLNLQPSPSPLPTAMVSSLDGNIP